jgi:RNA polymerase sigma-70 factor, ECF subfamily
MHTTSASLLEQLRCPGEQRAWSRFVRLYTPLLYHWARRLGLPPEDTADLVQEVFVALVPRLPEFVYDRRKSFRAWLRAVALNRWRNLLRRRCPTPGGGDEALAQVEAPDGFVAFEEEEYRQYLVRRALRLMQAEFQPVTWKACWEYAIVGRPAEEVAQELGITVNAVYLAKSRVLARLRQELERLLD